MVQGSPFAIEGVHLKGYGVVYTLTVPSSEQKIEAELAKPQRKRLTDWERIRTEIYRGRGA